MPYRLPPAEDKARYVQAKFDEIARHYDLFNDLITQGQHRRWKRVLVNRLGIHPAARVLDLCCGTGDLAARSLSCLGSAGRIVAVDFSPRMLAIARHRLQGAWHRLQGARHRLQGVPSSSARPPLVLGGDAMRLPFQTGTFDFITIGYGLRNVTGLEGCLDELLRVLKPGGHLASLDVGQVRTPWLRRLSDAYMFRVVPRIGRFLQRGQDMFDYLPHSTVDYPQQDALARMLADRGFEDVDVVEFLFGASVIHLARKPR